MGFDLTLDTSASYAGEDRSWTKSKKGYDTCRSITLDLSLFTAGTHFPNGYLPSGLVLGVVTATGRYGPYLDAAGDGRTVARGFLFSSSYVKNATGRQSAALMIEGIIDTTELPTGHGLDANGRLDLMNSANGCVFRLEP